jgi:hypothetical protein
VTETTAKNFYDVGFDALVKRWAKWMKCREANAFSRFEYHVFYVTSLLTLPHI